MDDADVERILLGMEEKYGIKAMRYGSRHERYRRILIDNYLYGTPEHRIKRETEDKRAKSTLKQRSALRPTWKDYWGESE